MRKTLIIGTGYDMKEVGIEKHDEAVDDSVEMVAMKPHFYFSDATFVEIETSDDDLECTLVVSGCH